MPEYSALDTRDVTVSGWLGQTLRLALYPNGLADRYAALQSDEIWWSDNFFRSLWKPGNDRIDPSIITSKQQKTDASEVLLVFCPFRNHSFKTAVPICPEIPHGTPCGATSKARSRCSRISKGGCQRLAIPTLLVSSFRTRWFNRQRLFSLSTR